MLLGQEFKIYRNIKTDINITKEDVTDDNNKRDFFFLSTICKRIRFPFLAF